MKGTSPTRAAVGFRFLLCGEARQFAEFTDQIGFMCLVDAAARLPSCGSAKKACQIADFLAA